MRFYVIILSIVLFSCTNQDQSTSDNSSGDDKKPTKKSEPPVTIKKDSDSIWFNLDSIKSNCKPVKIFNFSKVETSELRRISLKQFVSQFEGIEIKAYYSNDFDHVKVQGDTTYLLEDELWEGWDNYFQFWYHQYIDNGTYLLFSVGVSELGNIDKYIVFCVDKKSEKMLDNIDDFSVHWDYQSTKSINQNEFQFDGISEYDEGDEFFRDSLTTKYLIESGKIKRMLLIDTVLQLKNGQEWRYH